MRRHRRRRRGIVVAPFARRKQCLPVDLPERLRWSCEPRGDGDPQNRRPTPHFCSRAHTQRTQRKQTARLIAGLRPTSGSSLDWQLGNYGFHGRLRCSSAAIQSHLDFPFKACICCAVFPVNEFLRETQQVTDVNRALALFSFPEIEHTSLKNMVLVAIEMRMDDEKRG